MSEIGAEGITSQRGVERVIELERADAAKNALERAVKRIEGYKIRGETYRKALKLAVRLIREVNFVD